jgi:hypothetical protein
MSDRTAPRRLWLAAQHFLHELFNLIGAPEDIASQHTLTREPYKLLRDWIRAGEAFMRRLLFIEAAAYPAPNTRPLLHPRRARKRRLIGFDHDKPEAWRVSFRCLSVSCTLRQAQRDAAAVTAENCVSLCSSKAGDANRFHSAWPLAERYEALIRVFNDPAPYARRLAARLHAAPHRAAAIMRHPETAPDLFGRDSFALAERECDTAQKRFNSS